MQPEQPTTTPARGECSAWRQLGLLLGIAGLVYLPVMLHLPSRSTGDEKVYIAQAIEMARHGSWFQQTLFDEGNYYKGPLYYILMRLGMLVFGATAPFAITYMNLLGYGTAAAALWSLVRRLLPDTLGTAVLVPALVLFSAGAYAHALAGQMESLLISAYAVFMALLGTAAVGKEGTGRRLGAWCIAGLAGWLKSPLHALLLGTSALLFWSATGELRALLRRPRDWLAALTGVVVCIAGYAPALLYDPQNFISSYIERESLGRAANGVGIDEAVLPFLTAHLLPWLPLLLAALWILGRRWRLGRPSTAEGRRAGQLAFATILPTVAFFLIHPTRSGIYILPILPAVALVIGLAWHGGIAKEQRFLHLAWSTCAALVALVATLLTALIIHFSPFPPWWGTATSIYAVLGIYLALVGFLCAARGGAAKDQVAWALAASLGLYTCIGQIMMALEHHEEQDLRRLVQLEPTAAVYHANLNKYLWSETGIQSFMSGRPVQGLYTVAMLTAASAHGPILVTAPDAEQLAAILAEAARHPELKAAVHPWRRWRMQGETADGEPNWMAAWRTRSWSPLERQEYAVLLQRRAEPIIKVATEAP